jgi:hypothetical protein
MLPEFISPPVGMQMGSVAFLLIIMQSMEEHPG